MKESARRVMHECSQGSLSGSLTFPEVVSKLLAAGCEQYHADLRRQEKTYYMPGGESYVEPLPINSQRIADDFSAEAVVASLRAIQERQINYVQFLKQLLAAGCVGYLVYLTGRRAIYLGRQGDIHIEHFPPPPK